MTEAKNTAVPDFKTAEEMAEFYEAHKDEFDMMSGVDDFIMGRKSSRRIVARVKDDRAATVAMNAMDSMFFGSKDGGEE